jgi:hypothetical protein
LARSVPRVKLTHYRIAALVPRHVLRRSGADVVAEHRRGDPATLKLILGVGRRGV